MKRYYLDRLNLLQSILKSIIANILITLFVVIIILIAKIEFYYWYLYVLFAIYFIVIVVQIIKSVQKISFYIEGNSIIYCKGSEETRIELDNITIIEEYYGINYLFGKKTIILHEKNKKHNFVLAKKRAELFKNELETAINETGELTGFSI